MLAALASVQGRGEHRRGDGRTRHRLAAKVGSSGSQRGQSSCDKGALERPMGELEKGRGCLESKSQSWGRSTFADAPQRSIPCVAAWLGTALCG